MISMLPTHFGECYLVCGRETYFPLSQLLGELAYGESQSVHTTGGMETYIPLSLCYATWHPVTTTIHYWWKGNIYSIVTVLCDLAPGDSHPSYRQCTRLTVFTVYTVLYDTIKQHGHICVVFGGYGRRSQCIRCRALSPYRNIQSTSYRKHIKVPMSQ